MMQRLACVSISDPTRLDNFIQHHADLIDVATGLSAGGWGMGLWNSGEMLTRKTPITPHLDTIAVIRDAAVHQFVVVADDQAALRASRTSMQPLRYRDWVFAVTGTVSDLGGFIDRARSDLAGFGRPNPTLHELALTTMMHSLQQASALDRRPLSTTDYHAAIARGLQRLETFAGAGRESLQLALALHIDDHVFHVSAGRPLYVWEVAGAPRRDRKTPWSATIVTDFRPPQRALQATLGWSGLQVDSRGRQVAFEV